MLVENPLGGTRASQSCGRELRSFVVANHVIFYIAQSDGVEIVRVMNGRQDITADDMA